MKSRKAVTKSGDKGILKTVDRPFPYIVILGCAVLLILIGSYLMMNDIKASGFTTAGKYGTVFANSGISGFTTLLIGILLGIWPVIILLKIRKARRTDDNT